MRTRPVAPLVLVLLLALAPQPTSAQAPRAATAPLINLFADDTIAYLGVALRTGDGKGAPLDRLLADLMDRAAPAAELGGLGLLPQLARERIPRAQLDDLVTHWLAIEDEDLARDPACSFHTALVARPRTGVGGFLSRL